MARSEQELRREAVRRRFGGVSAAEVGDALGRSARWVQKWVERHDPADAGWAEGAKRGPERAPNRTPASVEAQVLAVRERLAEHPWAQVGAPAIAWELEKLGVEAPPLRTIERILKRAGMTERNRGRRRQPKGIPYPEIAAGRAGELHEADLVGPRYLDGGVRFYALNTVDLAPRRAGIEIVDDKSDQAVAGGLVALWQRLGVPRRAKFDNGGPFIGARGLGLVARVCLHNGVTPVFIPAGEPWRNGVVERFNDTFDKRFFRTERFPSRAVLEERALAFERFHNAHHRYAATGGQTPDESCAGGAPREPQTLAELPEGLPQQGRVEFIRFIRSDRKLRLMRRSFEMPPEVVYEYVTAELDLATQPVEGNLRVRRDGELVATTSITIGGRR
ncbi:MAG: integrase core domain-containing protein [Gammaproteobacteria bacterium]